MENILRLRIAVLIIYIFMMQKRIRQQLNCALCSQPKDIYRMDASVVPKYSSPGHNHPHVSVGIQHTDVVQTFFFDENKGILKWSGQEIVIPSPF